MLCKSVLRPLVTKFKQSVALARPFGVVRVGVFLFLTSQLFMLPLLFSFVNGNFSLESNFYTLF